jgi:hypothetical protein
MIARVRPLPRVRPRPRNVSIDEALRDPQLLGAALGDPRTWSTWLAVLRASAGLPLRNLEEEEAFDAVSGHRIPPTAPPREIWNIIGRGAGKSNIAAGIGVHAALLQPHRLARGEVGHVLILSATVAQAKIVFGYCLGFIEASKVLRGQLVDATQSEIRLSNNIIISTHPNSYRSVRGRTLVACVFDESAYWRDEASALPDVETYRAVLPSLIRSGGQLIGISTPYRKLGLLYQRWRDFYGKDDPDVLVVQGDSLTFNPTLSESAIRKAMAADPEAGLSEWQAEFRTDISAFLSDADIDAAIDYSRPVELPPRGGIQYRGYCDPSGGRHDHMTLAISHREGDRTIIDVLRGFAPEFDNKLVTAEFSKLLREYGLSEVTGDAYGAVWVEGEFKANSIRYRKSELPAGRLYIEGLPAFVRRTINLPDHPRLIRELRLLERRTHVGGRDSVNHGRTGSDDYANAAFGSLFLLQQPKPRIHVFSEACVRRDGTVMPGRELDPATMKPLGIPPGRINFVNVNEAGDVLRTRRVST